MVVFEARRGSWKRQGRDFVTPEPEDPGFVEGWGLPTWREEFETPGTLDPTRWNVRDRSTFGLLNDATVISRDNVVVDSNGICHIYGRWLDNYVTTTTGPSGNPTIRTHSTGYFEHRRSSGSDIIYGQQYGRWEIKAQVPTGPNTLGALAAFWLRNANTGELDIMESWGYGINGAFAQQNEGTSTLTTHTNTSGTGNIKKAWTVEQVLGIPYQTTQPVHLEYHTWVLEWTPAYFAGYRDGRRFCYETPTTYPNLWNPSYFGSPNHMRVNLHIGPSTQYWGLPNPNNKALTQDPLDYKIEHIRAWRYQGA